MSASSDITTDELHWAPEYNGRQRCNHGIPVQTQLEAPHLHDAPGDYFQLQWDQDHCDRLASRAVVGVEVVALRGARGIEH